MCLKLLSIITFEKRTFFQIFWSLTWTVYTEEKILKFRIAQGINQVISRLFHGVLADNKELCLWGFDHKLGKGCLLLGCLDSICFSALHELSMSFPSNAPSLVVKTWQISKNSAVISSSFFLPSCVTALVQRSPGSRGSPGLSVSVGAFLRSCFFSYITGRNRKA